jgi:acetyl esterase/lipase
MHEHAADYGGNPDELYLMGHSAGAHLVALVATDPSYLEAVRLSLGSLKGVVALDTQTYNIPLLMEGRRVAGGRIYRQAFGPDPADWEKLSPITHVTPGGGIPPFIVAYSGSGEGRAAQSEQFVEKLKEAGVIAELLSASDKTHAEINREFGQPGDAVTQAIFTFLATL